MRLHRLLWSQISSPSARFVCRILSVGGLGVLAACSSDSTDAPLSVDAGQGEEVSAPDSAADSAESSDSSDASAPVVLAADAVPSAACNTGAMPPADGNQTIDAHGVTRSF